MRKAFSKKETINKIIRMFLAQYLTSVGSCLLTQKTSVPFRTIASIYSPHIFAHVLRPLTLVVARIASNVKAITNMQSRTESNILHLVFCLSEFLPLEDMVKHLSERRSHQFNHGFF